MADLYTLVLEFHTAGSLDGDVASGMLAVLSACESRIARAKVKPAVSLLGAFKAQAAAAIDRGSLDPDQGRLLIDTASALADQLESGP